MRRRVVVAGFAITLASMVLHPSWPKGRDRAGSAEDELVNVVREWLDAEEANDRATLGRLVAEDFIGTAFGGKIVTKADVVPREGDGARFPKTSLKESAARLFGNTGVVMGLASFDDPNHPGQFRFTLVCMKREQGWQIVAAHLAHDKSQ